MSKSRNFLLLLCLLFLNQAYSQDRTTIEAKNADISDNLDLEAVASIFGESEDVEDFEKRLNDPKIQINNLDLNGDGEVDYLRVMETGSGNTHTLSIQSVIGKDQYQEVATIDVVKDKNKKTQVQVVGNVDMYGPNYYFTPYYPVVPVFFSFFWMATYRPYYSPWYWGYHPPYWNPWRPYPPYMYHNNVHVHVNVNNRYNYNDIRINNNNININSNNNSYFNNHPDKSFNKRNPGVSNKKALNDNRRDVANKAGINNKADLDRAVANKSRETKDYQSSGRPVTKPTTRPSTGDQSSTRPNTRPSTQPAAKPASRPSTLPTAKPASRPSSQPAAKPASRPSTSQSKQTSTYKRPSTASSRPTSSPGQTRSAQPRSAYRR